MRKLLLLVAIVMPNSIKLFIYRKLMGYGIGNNVSIGFSYIDCDHVIVEDDVSIGHFNIIRRLKKFKIGEKSYINNFNQFFFSGNKHQSPDWSAQLVIGKKVSFMSHHFIDVGGSVIIGDNSIIAGRDTHFWSHGFVPTSEGLKHTRMSLQIGESTYIGARATLLGCSIPDGAIVGAGSIVSKSFPAEDSSLLIAGNPAVVKKRYEFNLSA